MPDAPHVQARSKRSQGGGIRGGISRYGWIWGLSEVLYRAARRLARGPNNAAHRSHEEERRKLLVSARKLTAEHKKLKSQSAHQARLLDRAKTRVARDKERLEVLARKAQRGAEREEAWEKRLERLRAGPLFAYEVESLGRPSCVACDGSHLHILPYPSSISPSFSRLVVLLCATCGFGWVPSIPFDLEEYYRTEYGSGKRTRVDVPPADYFAVDGALHQPGGRLLRYFERSGQQLALIRKHKSRIEAMLDFGSGPGYALFLSEAATKHAIEPDDQSIKYLDYIGASRVQLMALQPGSYDVILASHSVEHMPIFGLFPTLGRLHTALRKDGVLCVEVPYGSLGRAHIPLEHEPHTLFFSPDALVRVIERAGFEVVERVARGPVSRQVLAEPLVTPKPDAWSSGLAEGLVVLARPRAEAVATPHIESVATRVLRPKEPGA